MRPGHPCGFPAASNGPRLGRYDDRLLNAKNFLSFKNKVKMRDPDDKAIWDALLKQAEANRAIS